MQQRQARGFSPSQGLCDRSWTPEEWDAHYARIRSLSSKDNKREPSERLRKRDKDFEEFFHPTDRKAKPIKVQMYEGYLDHEREVFPAYEPVIITKKGIVRYETHPF